MIANLMCATKGLKDQLMRQTSALTNKKAQGQQQAGLLGHAAIRAHPSHAVAAGVDSDLRTLAHDSGHNFTNIPAHAPAPGTPVNYATPACPAFPQRCPFGGACHACPVTVQAKLAINQPGDSYEQEADRMAERVMRMSESSIPTPTTASPTKSTSSAVPPIVHEALRTPGQPLDTATRTYMEPRFGRDFSQVRLHTDAKAAQSARAVNALAYTVKDHIVFGVGQHSPQTEKGRKLLAHELAHTIQQNAIANVDIPSSGVPISKPNDKSEIEAEIASAIIATDRGQTKPLKIQNCLERPTIQRVIQIPERKAEDKTSREAQKQIYQAKQLLVDYRLTDKDREVLRSRIGEAENALRTYRESMGLSTPTPVIMQTQTYGLNVIFVTALIAALGTLIRLHTSRNNSAAEDLAKALAHLTAHLKRVMPDITDILRPKPTDKAAPKAAPETTKTPAPKLTETSPRKIGPSPAPKSPTPRNPCDDQERVDCDQLENDHYDFQGENAAKDALNELIKINKPAKIFSIKGEEGSTSGYCFRDLEPRLSSEIAKKIYGATHQTFYKRQRRSNIKVGTIVCCTCCKPSPSAGLGYETEKYCKILG